MKKETLFKIISIGFGLFLGVVVAEIGFRIYHSMVYHDLSDVSKNKRPSVQLPEKELKLGQIIQLSANQDIIYDLLPSSSYRFQNVAVSTSTQGFRDKEYPKLKAKNTKRWIGLGDSVMFGWGVDEDKCYLTQLENQLNQSATDTITHEVINTGVPGYNTKMELATLIEKFDLTQIDGVLVNFVGNDLDLPDFIRRKPNYFKIRRSFLYSHVTKYKGHDSLLGMAPFDSENYHFQRDPNVVPEEYHHMIGQAGIEKALQELKDLSEEHGFSLLVFTAEPPSIISPICEKLELNFLDAHQAWEVYSQEHPDAEWKVAPNDWHPSAVGHSVIANALFKKMKELNF